MKAKKLFFKNENAEMCYSLEWHLREAKSEGLEKVTLLEAIPDNDNTFTWCTYVGATVDRCECRKAFCDKYTPNKSGRGTCSNRGKFYTHGEAVEFKVN